VGRGEGTFEQKHFLRRKENKMKKWLPSLLPLLGTLVTAALPQVQHFIIQFVSTHPAWASVITAAGMIFNHLQPAPGAPPSDSTVAKIGTSMLCLSLVLFTFFTTGCNYNQAEVVAAVQRVQIGLKTAQALVPQGNLLVQELQQIDPEAAEYVGSFIQIASPALGKAIAATDNYIQNPGADAYQAILNGVDAFTTQVDLQTLKLVGLKNPQSQSKAVGYLATVATTLHLVLALLENYSTSKQKKAMLAQSARVRFDQVRPFLKLDYARNEMASMGYKNADQLLAYAGF
jgi:hypothetical protein